MRARPRAPGSFSAEGHPAGARTTPRAPRTGTTSRTPPAPVLPEGRQIKRLSQAEMEERRRLGLCFNCNEKFGRGHIRVCQRIFLLNLAPDDDDDTASATADASPADPRISLHAISGVRTSEGESSSSSWASE